MSWLKLFSSKRDVYKAISYIDERGIFYPGRTFKSNIHRSAEIRLGGKLFFGFFAKPRATQISHKPQTVLSMGENSKLNILGDVYIRPGTTISIGPDSELTFHGNNTIGSDSLIVCNNRMTFHHQAEVSWNVTMIDEDFHRFQKDNSLIQKPLREMVLGENSGVMSNVLIPKGVTVGRNTVIGGGVVLRQSIGDNCSVYERPELVIREGVFKPNEKD